MEYTFSFLYLMKLVSGRCKYDISVFVTHYDNKNLIVSLSTLDLLKKKDLNVFVILSL